MVLIQDLNMSLNVCNTLGWPRLELITVDEALIQGLPEQYDQQGRGYQLVSVNGFSISPPRPMSFSAVSVEKQV